MAVAHIAVNLPRLHNGVTVITTPNSNDHSPSSTPSLPITKEKMRLIEDNNNDVARSASAVNIESSAELEVDKSVLSSISSNKSNENDTNEVIFIPLNTSNIDNIEKSEVSISQTRPRGIRDIKSRIAMRKNHFGSNRRLKNQVNHFKFFQQKVKKKLLQHKRNQNRKRNAKSKSKIQMSPLYNKSENLNDEVPNSGLEEESFSHDLSDVDEVPECEPEIIDETSSLYKTSNPEPKVIVEMSPLYGINFLNISAFKESDSESEDELPMDESMGIDSSPPSVVHETIAHSCIVDMRPSCEQNAKVNEQSSKQDIEVGNEIVEPMQHEVVIENTSADDTSNLSRLSDTYSNECELEEIVFVSEVEVEVIATSTPSSPVVSTTICARPQPDRSLVKRVTKQLVVNMPSMQEKRTKSQRSLKIPNVNAVKTSKRQLTRCDYLMKGKGMKLKDFPAIKREILQAPSEILKSLHSILFDELKSYKKSVSVAHAKNDILGFNGFPFTQTSPFYVQMKNRLTRMHSYHLTELAQMLFGTPHCIGRVEMVSKILDFLMMPTRETMEEVRSPRRVEKVNSRLTSKLNAEYAVLKSLIESGEAPAPKVIVEKLKSSELKQHLLRKRHKSPVRSLDDEIQDSAAILEKNHMYPAYLDKLIRNSESRNNSQPSSDITSNGADMQNLLKEKVLAVVPAVRQPLEAASQGKKLKFIPGVVDRINAAEERIIHLIHGLLFGALNQTGQARNNILEFTGFRNSWLFLDHRKKFLRNLTPLELKKICDIFALPYDDENASKSIDDLLEFLKDLPENVQEQDSAMFSALSCGEPQAKPLSSFENIRFNIECATPDELAELHDILYIKSCDTFEIHQRILKFTHFAFDSNSTEFHTRKTLMSYMSLNSLRRILNFLDLKSLEFSSNKEEMIWAILKFFLDPKVPLNDNALQNNAHIVKLQCLPPSNSLLSSIPQVKTLQRSNAAVQDHMYSAVDVSSPVICISPTESYSSSSDEEAENNMPLLSFVSHPSNSQLKKDILDVMKANLLRVTMNELVETVLSRYPQFDLRYRKKFIKSKARKILSCIQRTSLSPASRARLSICSSQESQLSICPVIESPIKSSTTNQL